MNRKALPGNPFPLGATWDGKGVNFAIFSEHATGIELCLFDDPAASAERRRIPLREITEHVWHAYLPGINPGQLYGYRAHGSYEPQAGLRFNPSKLLIDPYAKALVGRIDWDSPTFAYQTGHPDADLSYDDGDDAWGVPKGLVIDPTFDWGNDQAPSIPRPLSVIYEVHVKGFTYCHPDLPDVLRGTYAGLASPPVVKHLKELGVTAVELLPVHTFLDDKHLTDRGLTNYWGYNSINYFAPEPRYSSSSVPGGQVAEFKAMVKELHRAGLEVILDVVYNHTGEGNELGPTLSFRGIDNPAYYRLVSGQERYYMDYTGTGNSLNVRHPQILQLIMDSLRYWVTEMHVDGFRFDLASALARELHDVDRLAAFFDIIHQDPVISQVKLIAEPWDVGEGGYQVGNFPVRWKEWNGKYRDTVRRFWRGDNSQIAEIAYRLTGSSDLYQGDGRQPYASINFITAHDGFTLHDLVSYERKHNEDNGEGNRDGSDENYSANYGVEGPTEDEWIIAIRERQKRNFLATLFFSQGVPMICGGDEMGRTQRGNNNAYCQDNEISWHDWQLDERRQALLDFARRLIRFRHEHPNLRRRKFFTGRPIRGSGIKDLMWLRPDGCEMSDEDWDSACCQHTLGMWLSGEALDEVNDNGEPLTDDTFFVILNAVPEAVPFVLPRPVSRSHWEVSVDTANPDLLPGQVIISDEKPLEIAPQSLLLLTLRLGDPESPVDPH